MQPSDAMRSPEDFTAAGATHSAVIYLGRPETSAVIEAYRHLVEAVGIPPSAVRPRTFYTVRAEVREVLDLTDETTLDQVGLTIDDLSTEVDDYDRCQEVAAAAHQLGIHGILAPAAHRLGQTLAIFKERVGHLELPTIEADELWAQLPLDPRIPRAAERVVPAPRSGRLGSGESSGSGA